MKSDIKIKGTELVDFHKKNPTALFWLCTGWGYTQLLKDSKGWYTKDSWGVHSYFSKHQLEVIPEITVYIPPSK